MPVDMYLYLPLDGSSSDNTTILDHAVALAGIYAAPPAEKKDEEEEEDNYNWRRRRGGGANLPADLSKFHTDRGFFEILAWSHGCSSSASVFTNGRGNMQDISMTKYNDKFSPLAYVATMRGELLPKAVLRVLYPAKDGKFDIIEYGMEQVQLSSVSTGGSGGEDRLTENITLTFGKLSVRTSTIEVATGEIVSDTRGSWNLDSNSGTRDGASVVPPLGLFCKRYFNDNRALFSKKEIVRIVKAKIADASEVGLDKSQLSLPTRGRRLLFAKETQKDRFREEFIHALTVAAIRDAAVRAFGLKAESLDSIFLHESGGRLVEILKDDQVETMVDEDAVIFSIKA